MSVLIGFLHDGVLLGSIRDTAAEALDELCEQYGDGVAVAYAEAAAAAGAVGQRESDVPRRVAAEVPAPVVSEGDGGEPAAAADQVDTSGPEGAEPAGDGQDDSTGAGAGGVAGAPAEAAPDAETTSCSICGAGNVPADWVSVSQELYGDIRCVQCSSK